MPRSLEDPIICQVLINNYQLPVTFKNYLVRVIVEHDLQLPSLFQIEFSNLSLQPSDDFNFDDLNLFQPGNSVEIRSGSKFPLTSVIKGEILGLQPYFSSDRPLRLTVWGCDYLHRLQRSTKTRSFVKMKDSDIASQIAKTAGLQTDVVDTKNQHEYLMQVNQSDLQFLQARAQQIGYELSTEGKTLFFRPLLNDSQARYSFDLKFDLLEFQPRLSLAGQSTKTIVSAWDADIQKPVFKSVNASSNSPGLKMLATVETTFVDLPVTPLAAETVARAQAEHIKLNLITGEATSIGEPGLKPGQQVELKGLGQKFSGQYFVTAVTHRYDSEGYLTDFKVKRNSL